MLESLKKIDKKFWVILGGIIGAMILLVMVVSLTRSCSSQDNNYSKLERKMVEAAEEYIKSDGNTSLKDGTSVVVSIDTLVSGGYLSKTSKYVKDTCKGNVTIMNNGGVGLYIPYLECGEYTTKTLASQIIADSLLQDKDALDYKSGLYSVGDEYIFKGKNVNNYVSFGGITWRILKIDSNGNLRLIKSTPEKSKIQWDTKFNAEADRNYGVNSYVTSTLAEELNTSYKGFKKENRKHLVPQDVCVGKRKREQLGIGLEIDCAEVLKGQYISVMNLSDFPMASLDENCNAINSGSCTNFNYLLEGFNTVWTTNAVADNTYEVYYMGPGMANIDRARQKNYYYWIIHVNGNELYQSGDGTVNNPYTIG